MLGNCKEYETCTNQEGPIHDDCFARDCFKTSNKAPETPHPISSTALNGSIPKCEKCKGWGGQGTIGTVTEDKGNYRTCMIDMFGDDSNEDWKPMFQLNITFGHGKGNIAVHRYFGCVNFNPDFDKE